MNIAKANLNLPSLSTGEYLSEMFEECDDTDRPISEYFFTEEIAPDLYMKNGQIETCLFKKCRLPESKILKSYVRDSEFVNCDLSNADFTQTTFRRARFVGCRLTGAKFVNCLLEDVIFEDCKADYSNFFSASFRNVLIKGGTNANGSFGECKIRNLGFSEANLIRCEFLHTNLAGIDLSDSIITAAAFSVHDIKGATLSYEQALYVAQTLLNIKIADF